MSFSCNRRMKHVTGTQKIAHTREIMCRRNMEVLQRIEMRITAKCGYTGQCTPVWPSTDPHPVLYTLPGAALMDF